MRVFGVRASCLFPKAHGGFIGRKSTDRRTQRCNGLYSRAVYVADEESYSYSRQILAENIRT